MNTTAVDSTSHPWMRLALLLLLWLFAAAAVHAQSWYNASWSHRKPITIDGSKVSSGPHANFPVLVSLASDAQLASRAQASGNDILFTAADGTTKLDHEIESYTSATGALVCWVGIPNLPSASNTVIYVYYGNAAASSQENASGVWSASYRAVWHFNETSGGTDAVKDSTSSANHGTNTGNPAFGQSGQIRRAVYYDGANKYILSASEPAQPFSQRPHGDCVGSACGERHAADPLAEKRHGNGAGPGCRRAAAPTRWPAP